MNAFENQIVLNRLAGGYDSIESGCKWFDELDEAHRRTVIRSLGYLVVQSGATSDDVPRAIEAARLKATFTPCVQLQNGEFRGQVSKVVQLPDQELAKSFRLLIEILRTADSRRKQECGDGCSHWWHQNLGDEEVVTEIKRRYLAGEL